MDMMKKVMMIVGLLLIVGYGYYYFNAQKSVDTVKIQKGTNFDSSDSTEKCMDQQDCSQYFDNNKQEYYKCANDCRQK